MNISSPAPKISRSVAAEVTAVILLVVIATLVYGWRLRLTLGPSGPLLSIAAVLAFVGAARLLVILLGGRHN